MAVPDEDKVPDNQQQDDLQSRREFLINAAAVGSGLALTAIAPENCEAQGKAMAAVPPLSGELVDIELKVNGSTRKLRIDPRASLLDTLREWIGLTGTKKGCDHGQCGACTVLVNGTRINSCLTFAVMQQGKEITTVEGLARGEVLHPMQQAFIDGDGFQCGYCTPGQICSAIAMLDEFKKGTASAVTENLSDCSPRPLTEAEIKERMSGNLCRCAAYPGIVEAIKQVAGVRS